MIGALDNKEHISQIGELLIVIPVEPMLSRSILEAMLVENVLKNSKDSYQFLSEGEEA